MSADVDCLVIGAGVVGLAVARALALAGRAVMVIEQHDRVGAETSSRNSEVIHAGLYYPPGSLKARLCVRGKALLYRFADENGVPVQRLGKLLVAAEPAEVPALAAIAANAQQNGVDDLVALDAASARALEPALRCVAAYFSPSTGIIDSHAYLSALEGHLQAAGGEVVLSTTVRDVQPRDGGGFHVFASSGAGDEISLSCNRLVIAAGLHSSTLATRVFSSRHDGTGAASGVVTRYAPPETTFAKGHYFTLSRRAPFSHLVYPMPGDGGLGVHLTLDIGGMAKFGPDVTWVDHISYAFDDADGARRRAFIAAIRRWWPELPAEALQDGYTGIRPKLSARGAPAADFAIHDSSAHGLDGLVALYGIESPGLTAALAIAEHVAELLS